MTDFSKILRKLASGTSAVVIAGRMTEAGMPTTVSAVRLWLSGDRVPGGDRLPFLARALNVTPNDLLGFSKKSA